MLELKEAQMIVRTIERLMEDNIIGSVYLPAAMSETASKFWQDFLAARVSPDKLARMIDRMDENDPNWADASSIYDQIMDGFTLEAKKAGVDRIVFGVHVWNPKSLTETNVKTVDDRLRRII